MENAGQLLGAPYACQPSETDGGLTAARGEVFLGVEGRVGEGEGPGKVGEGEGGGVGEGEGGGVGEGEGGGVGEGEGGGVGHRKKYQPWVLLEDAKLIGFSNL